MTIETEEVQYILMYTEDHDKKKSYVLDKFWHAKTLYASMQDMYGESNVKLYKKTLTIRKIS